MIKIINPESLLMKYGSSMQKKISWSKINSVLKRKIGNKIVLNELDMVRLSFGISNQ